MTPERMAKAEADGSEWLSFWKNLKSGYDWFEKSRRPPDCVVVEGQYRFIEEG
jgi:murein L,D-transpeptidase YafK